MAPTRKTVQNATDESIKLLEASKTWRAELGRIELQEENKAAANQLQKLELAQTETTIIAKGVGPMTLGKESQDDLKRALKLAFQSLNAGGIQVEYARRLQRVKGDRGVNPPAMKVKLSNVTDKLRL